jgi:hypothetical protein
MSYTNNDIYLSALALIDESESKGDTADLAERAPFILASFCSTCRSLDKKLRLRDSLEAQGKFSSVKLPLENEFPLCEVLSAPAAAYLASMLVIDENPALSESLYDKYCDAIATIGAECSCSAISDVYFY